MFTRTWDTTTTQGKKHLAQLTKIVKALECKDDLRVKIQHDPVLRRVGIDAILGKLAYDGAKRTLLGKVWTKKPRKPNALFRNFPNKKVHPKLKQALAAQSNADVAKEFPIWLDLTDKEKYRICRLLRVRRPFKGAASTKGPGRKPKERKPTVSVRNWWEHLKVERKKEFDERYLKDYRNVDIAPDELLRVWPEAINAEGLAFAAQSLGERQSRAQIRSDHLVKQQAEKLRHQIEGFERTIRSIDEVAAKHKGIPKTDSTAPLLVKAKSNDESIATIGSSFTGLIRPDDTFAQPLSNRLRLAEESRTRSGEPDILIITGDLTYLDTIRYSNLTAKRSVLEDIPLVPDVIEDTWVLEQIEKGEMVFLTFKEKLEMLLRVLAETFAPGGKPLYNGRILICLGKREGDIANYMANERANAEVALVRANFMIELGDLRLELKTAKQDHDYVRVEELELKIKAIMRRQHERLKATSIWRRQLKELFEMALRYVAVRLEETIPNSEVISAGDAFIQVGDELIEVRQKGTESSKDTLEDKLIEDFSTRATAGERVPDLTLGGGLNPVWTRGEIDQARGEFSKPNMTAPFIVTLPTCMPSGFLRDAIKEIHGVTTAGGLAKLIRSRDFTGGTFDMNWVSGLPLVRFWTDECLSNRELWSSKKAIEELMDGNNMIYELVSGCEHRGQNWQAYFDTENVDIFTETVWKFILDHDVPLHMVHFLGDKWTGHNFPGKSYQKPEKWLSPDQVRHLVQALDLWPDRKEIALEILRSKGPALRFILREFESGDLNPRTFQEKYVYLRRKMRENAILTGIDALDLQRASWKLEVLPYEAEIVARALMRSHTAGVSTLGHSMGLCLCHTGNHVANTEHKSMGLHVQEGPMVANDLQEAVRMTHPGLWGRGKLTEEVIAPVIGTSTKAEGLFGRVPPKLLPKLSVQEREAYMAYRMAAKHKGAQGGSKYTDLIRVIRHEDAKRGRRRAHGEKYSVTHTGHVHYCFSTASRHRYLTAGGCHTFDDPYGEGGNYRLTSVCTTVNGFPARGPAWGPITEVHLRFAEFKDFIKKPWPVDIKRLFPNPVV